MPTAALLPRPDVSVQAAQRVGKWTGRAPRGFYVGDDKRLHVDVEEFLRVRHALERVAAGESKRQVATDSGIPGARWWTTVATTRVEGCISMG